jgi:hypothetical protein
MSIGATFKKFDLHLHAPGTGQKFTMPSGEKVPSTDKEMLDFARRYVQQAHEVADLDLIAITNHNDACWIDPLRQAAQELYGDEFVVLPGLEVAADGGINSIHVLAVFPEDTSVDILERFLDDDLALTSEKRFTQEGYPCPSSHSFIDVVNAIVVKRGGIAIAAHVFSSEDSLLDSHSNRGLSRKAQFCHPRLQGVGINKSRLEDLSEWQRFVVTNQHHELDFRREHPIACLNCSDARKLESIGQCYTFVKCEKPSFEALEQALLDHEARLRLQGDPPPEPALRLVNLSVEPTSTGFLRGLDIAFNPCLNCLIGGRGTGKSAIIELVRYLWEQEPLRPEETEGFESVFLPETAEATLQLVRDNVIYRLHKRGRERTRIECQEPGVGWIPKPDLHPRDLFPLDIYGQKEILYTSEDVRSQLSLLDRMVGEEIGQLKRERDGLLIDLRRNREAIIGLCDRLEQKAIQLEDKAKIEEQLHRYHRSGLGDMAQAKRLYDREMQAWDLAFNQVNELEETLTASADKSRLDLGYLGDDDLAPLPNRGDLEKLRTRLERLASELEAALVNARQVLDQARDDIQGLRSTWQQERDNFDVKYREALSKLPDITPDTVTRLERERMQLGLVERELEELKAEIRRGMAERKDLQQCLLDLNQRLYNSRSEKAQDISSRLPRVRVKVAKGGDRDWLVAQLHEYLRGSRLREDDYRTIAQAATPNPLALLAAVESADPEVTEDLTIYSGWLPEPEPSLLPREPVENLANLCGIDTQKASKLIEYLPLSHRLELDELPPPDRVTVELNIAQTEGLENWRALGQRLGEGVSVGQGCTAILSIILLESDHPLIIDQPEDDLDNRFIYDEVVKVLREERGQRQMLVATHNANIPVAGDAELIIALDTQEEMVNDRTSLHCRVLARGFVDNPNVKQQVKDILEGGDKAFELRKQKYGF